MNTMKEDYKKENDPERKVFRTALNSMEIQPSEKFWNSALHGIIDKEKVSKDKRIISWKGVSVVLGGIVVLLLINNWWMYDRMNKVEQDIATIKNEKSKRPADQNAGAVVNADNANNTKPSSQVEVASPSAASKSIIAANTIHTGNTSTNQNTGTSFKVAIKGSQLQKGTHYNSVSAGVNPMAAVPESFQNTETHSVAVNQSRAGNSIEKQQSGNDQQDATVSKEALIATKNKSLSATLQSDSVSFVANQNTGDSANILSMNELPKPKIELKKKLSLSAFFAPGGISDFLEDRDNDYTDDVTINSLKAQEVDLFSYEAGVKLGLDVSNKLTVRTGLYYYLYTYNIKQSIITARTQRDGTVGYSIVTSSGLINMPYTASVPKVGDSLKVRGSSSRSYVCIPLEFTYMFLTHNRLGLYMAAGASASIIHNSVTELNWQNTLLESGDAVVGNSKGLAALSYSYSLGIGLTYKVFGGFSVYAEPYLQGSVTSISKNAPITIYPYFFGAAGGITYHF